MLANTNVYLQRLVALREYGFPLAEQMQREGRLNFGVYMRRCGTYGCLLGWWATTEYAQADGWVLEDGVLPAWQDFGDMYSAEMYFGLTDGQWSPLFGINSDGTLADRRAYLDTLIAERMQVVA